MAECIKVFAGHDGALYEESYNLLNAWLAVVPGSAFGAPGFLRLSYAASLDDLRGAVERLRAFAEAR